MKRKKLTKRDLDRTRRYLFAWNELRSELEQISADVHDIEFRLKVVGNHLATISSKGRDETGMQ